MAESVGMSSPKKFGRALAQARERAGVSLADIAARTKISRRILEGLESGEFSRLPGETFGRLFLRQYLELIGEPTEPWMSAFAAAWRCAEEQSSSAAIPAVPAAPAVHSGKAWAWGVGVLLVVGVLAGLAVFQRARHGAVSEDDAAPLSVLALATPRPVETAPAPSAEQEESPPCVLSLSTRDWPCWVEVQAAGGFRQSRLLAGGERWELQEASGVVELLVGDAAAVEVCFHGRVLPPLGGRGQVVRLRLDPKEYLGGGPVR